MSLIYVYYYHHEVSSNLGIYHCLYIYKIMSTYLICLLFLI
jgi:hypothetical protein